MQLHRRFSAIQLLLISVNGMVGSAWLFAPLYAAKIAGSGAIIAWILAALITILIALTFAELSTMLPLAGGTTQFPRFSHGIFASFTISWIAWLSCVTMPPIEVQAVLQYASTYFPFLVETVNNAPVLSNVGLCWAVILMVGLCIINVASFRGLIGFNFILFSFKILVIILTVIWLMKTHFQPQNFLDIKESLTFNGWHAILTAVASGGIVFAFTGFKHGVELAGEAKNSRFTIPFAIIGSVIFCLLLYIALQISFIGAVDSSALTKGWHHLTYSGDVGPFVGIATLLGLFWLAKLLYIDAAVSPLGAGMIYVTSTARIIYAMSENGYLPKKFTELNGQQFPIWAIAFNFIVGMLLFLPLPGWQNMVEFLVSAVVISYAIGPIALLCLREQMPNTERPFRLPAARFICLIAFYCCNLISYWTGWNTIYKLAIAMALGFIIFGIGYLRGNVQSKGPLGLKALQWIVPYFVGLCLFSYLGAFGGKGLIPFGWDFLAIGVFSIFILYLAVRSRLSHNTEREFISLYGAREEGVTKV
jgi:amino acid transporter